MNLIEKMSTKMSTTLQIDLGDTFITVEKRGTYDGRKVYSWSTMSPTEGGGKEGLDYSSEIIYEEEIRERVGLLMDREIPEIYQIAIKLFIGESI